MDKSAAVASVRRYAELVCASFDVQKVIIFGSFASGTARDDSDIDVAVVLKRIDGDYLDLLTRLSKLRREIEHRIEPVVLEEGKDKSGFLGEILKSGEIIYSA